MLTPCKIGIGLNISYFTDYRHYVDVVEKGVTFWPTLPLVPFMIAYTGFHSVYKQSG